VIGGLDMMPMVNLHFVRRNKGDEFELYSMQLSAGIGFLTGDKKYFATEAGISETDFESGVVGMDGTSLLGRPVTSGEPPGVGSPGFDVAQGSMDGADDHDVANGSDYIVGSEAGDG
jgi:hypothetical protein